MHVGIHQVRILDNNFKRWPVPLKEYELIRKKTMNPVVTLQGLGNLLHVHGESRLPFNHNMET